MALTENQQVMVAALNELNAADAQLAEAARQFDMARSSLMRSEKRYAKAEEQYEEAVAAVSQVNV
jgi:predicted DNA-binding protein YlxM (UPF0122 family)